MLFVVFQVTTLVAQKGPSRTKKGQSPKAHVLSAAVQMATEHFIMKGEEIANENQEIRNDMLAAVDDVRVTGMLSGFCIGLVCMSTVPTVWPLYSIFIYAKVQFSESVSMISFT